MTDPQPYAAQLNPPVTVDENAPPAPALPVGGYRLFMAALAGAAAAIVGGWMGMKIGGCGDKRGHPSYGRTLGGLWLGLTFGAIALDANLRPPQVVASLQEKAEEKKRAQAQALATRANAVNGFSSVPSPQISASAAAYGGVLQPDVARVPQAS